MVVKQGDLFKGMDRDFIKKVMDQAEHFTYREGVVLFEEGQPADRVFILLSGSIRLSIGDVGQVVYNVDHAGELFGWSTLMGRDFYSASAVCTRESRVVVLYRDDLTRLMDLDPDNGLIFYRRIARMLGARLLESYNVIGSMFRMEESPTQATGQLERTQSIQ